MYKQIEEKLPNVKLGMTREQVRSIVGEPESVSKFDYRGRKLETWYFPQELATVSDRTHCTFDADTGRAIRVTVRGKVERIDEAFRRLRYGPPTMDRGAETKKSVGAE
ncbi:MAG: outer membrane protein assembly factor BamE domain-containing protein [Planctomycetota bacterium]